MDAMVADIDAASAVPGAETVRKMAEHLNTTTRHYVDFAGTGALDNPYCR